MKNIIKNINRRIWIQQDKWIKYDVEFLISLFIYLFLTYLKCSSKDFLSFFSSRPSSPMKKKETSWFYTTAISPKSSKNMISSWLSSTPHGNFTLISGVDTAKSWPQSTPKLPINLKPKTLQVNIGLTPVKLAKVDATVDPKVAGEYKVQGYPTIFFFHKGEKIDYNGQRSKEYLLNWLLKKTRDPLVPVDEAGYEKLKSDDKVSIVFHGDASSAEGQIVSKLAVADDFNSKKLY